MSWGRGMKPHKAGPERQKFAVLVGSQTPEIKEVAGPPLPRSSRGCSSMASGSPRHPWCPWAQGCDSPGAWGPALLQHDLILANDVRGYPISK